MSQEEHGAGLTQKASISSRFFGKLMVLKKEGPFAFLDSVSLNLWGERNFLKLDAKMRRVSLLAAAVSLGFWVVMGFDSSYAQLELALYALVPYVTGAGTWDRVVSEYSFAYGKFMHWSAIVIYGLVYYGLSKHLADNRVIGSRNVLTSASVTFLSIAAFEYFWMVSYYLFQGQTWILSMGWPQFRIHWQNMGFIVLAALELFYLWAYEIRFSLNIDRLTLGTFLWTSFLCTVWILYGVSFPVERLTVPLETGGSFTTSPLFPQTVYTIDLNPLDTVTAGTQFYLENNLLHAVNTMAKIFMSLTFYSLFKMRNLKKVEQK